MVAILFSVISRGTAQDATVSGIVVSKEDGEPLIGATVLVKGTNRGMATDIEGKFHITQVPVSARHLVISYVGLETQEVPIKPGFIRVELKESTLIEEIVVTALGTSRSADKLGSTASVISTDKLLKSGQSTLLNAMAGKAAGVRISSPNGDVGSGSNIIIRGVNTFIGDSQPLVIVDGVPISNENYKGAESNNVTQQSRINDLNQDDIASLQVLKGASAAALWGSRAANGVIVITTKNGEKGTKPNITYSYTKSIDWISFKHPIQNKYGQGTGGKWNKNSNLSWGDKIADRSGEADEYDTSGAYFIADSGKIYYPITKKNSRETFVDSNFDAVYGNGGFDQHSFSISGGNDRTNYFISYGGLFQDGTVKNAYYNKHNIRLNASYRFADWLKVNSKASYIISTSNRVYSNGDTTNGAYLALLRNPADFDVRDYKGSYVDASGQIYPNRQRMYRSEIGATQQPTYNNPLWSTNEQKSIAKVNRFIYSPEIVIDPLSWLNVTLRGGLDYYTETRDTYFPIGSSYRSYTSGYYNYLTSSRRELNFDAIVRGTHNPWEHIALSWTVGFNINDRETVYNNDRLSSFDVDTDIVSSSLSANASASTWTKTLTQIRSNRGYAIIDLELYDQLYITLTGMQEAASTLVDSYFYPSADIAWQFTKNIDSKILSFGKLRASWGKVGTQPDAYKTQTLATTDYSSFGGSYAVSSERGNSHLKPEIKTEWEIGADLRFFKNRLDLKMTYYQNHIKDLLFDVELNPSSGYSTNYSNAGKMQNKGFELEASYLIFDKKDFTWSANLNFSKNKNKVTSLGGTGIVTIGGSSVALEGYPVGVLYRPGSLRDENGNLVLDDNGFPQLATSNLVLGDPNPKWRGGLGMDFSYKNFDFSFLFEHSHGGRFLNRTMITLYGFGTHEDVSHEITLTEDLKNYKGEVFTAGTTLRGNVHNFGAGNVLLDESWYNGLGGGLGTSKSHDLYMEDNTWTKLRNITLGYTFKSAWLKKKTQLSSIRLSVTGRDLICWNNLTGIDPESNNYGVSNAQGMDYFSSPATRSVLFNIQITY
ncbi:MAG: SusC/RagA family TonB-linked outer membrane protein [Bacteroides sp.]|nr:SusC/RagA family TonB-linked outer membrane protein [Bacteroides sp.]